MVNPEILDYVKKELERRVSEAKLRQVLIENGWPESEISEAFEETKKVVEKTSEKLVEEKKEEKPFREVLKEISGEKPKEVIEEKLVEEAGEKSSIVDNIKKLVTNKIFMILIGIIVLGLVASLIIPSLFKGAGAGGVSGDAMDYADEMCRQYCNSNLCGMFIDPKFEYPELEGKNCIDLGISCLQPNGNPKCETEY